MKTFIEFFTTRISCVLMGLMILVFGIISPTIVNKFLQEWINNMYETGELTVTEK